MTLRTATILSSTAYLVVTFPLAIVWHLVLFKTQYEAIGYIGRDEPIFVFGFLAILAQGILLSMGYRIVVRETHSIGGGIRYALAIGLFFWTSHVLAFAAKGDIARLDVFFPLETVYLAFQFGIFGVLLGFSHGKANEMTNVE